LHWPAQDRAVSMRAPAESVWQWLVQIGQGRGGMYSYDARGTRTSQPTKPGRLALERTSAWVVTSAGSGINTSPGNASARSAAVEPQLRNRCRDHATATHTDTRGSAERARAIMFPSIRQSRAGASAMTSDKRRRRLAGVCAARPTRSSTCGYIGRLSSARSMVRVRGISTTCVSGLAT
jgi:hypothetical protein